MDHARPSSNVMHGACEDARTRRACANTLLYFSCLKHVNEIVLGKSRPAHQRKQSFRFPLQSCTRTLDRLLSTRTLDSHPFHQQWHIVQWSGDCIRRRRRDITMYWLTCAARTHAQDSTSTSSTENTKTQPLPAKSGFFQL